MPTYTQANQPIEVITPLGKDVLLITGFRGSEGLSRPFHFQIDALADSKTDIAFEKVLGQGIAVRLNVPNGKPRFFSGICNRVSQGEGDKDFTAYHLEIVPQFWLLTKRAQTRTFQQMSVPDILKKVLQGIDVASQIQGTFQPRNYCVQYRETDFNFASRLMEEEGIFYFFTHSEKGHQMVLANTPASHPDMPQFNKLTFEKVLTASWPEDRITSWQKQQELVAGQHMLWDHSFELNGKNLQAKMNVPGSIQAGKTTHNVKAGNADNFEIYDYPGDYALRFDGINPGGGEQAAEIQKIFKDNVCVAGIRSQQEAVHSVVITGAGTCRNLLSGHKFSLQKHASGDGDYVLTGVHHQTTGSVGYVSDKAQEFRYGNSFTAIPFAMPFRPQRLTPKPFVQGTQTAVVVGPPGLEIFTDKYGRVKVQFNWDREGKHDPKSSCWVRVAQAWAGKRWGASFWPRIGQEVIVAFLEGNPDWPIIVGSVYNNEQMPPYLGTGVDPKHPTDNKVAGIKSNSTPGGKGFNEWRFDDTQGKEEVFIHAQRNMDTRVLHDTMERVIHDRHLIVGWEKDGDRGGDQREMVYQDKHLDVKRDHVEQVEGNMQLTVGKGDADAGGNVDIVIEKDQRELIEGNDHRHVKGAQNTLIDKDQSLIVGGAQIELIKGDEHLLVKGARKEQVAASRSLTVGGDKSESVSGDVHHQVKGNRNEKVGGTQSLSIDGSQYEKVGDSHALETVKEIHLKAGMKVIIEAGSQLTIKGAGGFVDIGPSGVTIQGTMVLINSGGSAGSGSGSSPTAPKDPAAPTEAKEPLDAKQARPVRPNLADDSKSGAKSAPG